MQPQNLFCCSCACARGRLNEALPHSQALQRTANGSHNALYDE